MIPNETYNVYGVVEGEDGDLSNILGPKLMTLPIAPRVNVVVMTLGAYPTFVDISTFYVTLMGSLSCFVYFEYSVYIIESSAELNVRDVVLEGLTPVYNESVEGDEAFDSNKIFAELDTKVRRIYKRIGTEVFIDFTKLNYLVVTTRNSHAVESKEVIEIPPRYTTSPHVNVVNTHFFISSNPLDFFGTFVFNLGRNLDSELYVLFYHVSDIEDASVDMFKHPPIHLSLGTEYTFQFSTFTSAQLEQEPIQPNSNYFVFTRILNTVTGEYLKPQTFPVSTTRSIEVNFVQNRSEFGIHLENSVIIDNTITNQFNISIGLIFNPNQTVLDSKIIDYLSTNTTRLTTLKQSIELSRNSADGRGSYLFMTDDTLLQFYQVDLDEENKYRPMDNVSENVFIYVLYSDFTNTILFKTEISGVPPIIQTTSFISQVLVNEMEIQVQADSSPSSEEYRYYFLATSEIVDDVNNNGFYLQKLLDSSFQSTTNEVVHVTHYYNHNLNNTLPLVPGNTYNMYMITKHTATGVITFDNTFIQDILVNPRTIVINARGIKGGSSYIKPIVKNAIVHL